MTQELHSVGKSKIKRDSAPKLTGKALFTADMKMPDMLEGRIFRSTEAHANIVKIDTSKAKALPGVMAVVTHDDVPKRPFTRSTMAEGLPSFAYEEEVLDQYILSEKSRYVGDWIAAVAAVDVYTAEKALDLITVEYEKLTAVYDPFEASKPKGPIIHESAKDNIASAMEHPFNCGEVEKGLEEADVVVELTGKNSRQKHCHLEPDSALASWGTDGRLTMISPSQGAHMAKKHFAKIFDLPEKNIRWISPDIGGGFGARLALGVEPVAAFLARVTAKPVRVTTTREEDFAGWGGRTEQHQTMKLGAKKDGSLTALDLKIVSDSGAYFSHSGTTSAVNMQHTLGLFRCPNVHGELKVVYTNTPIASGFRGYGNVEGAFVLQQGMDMLAEKANMDPIDFRMKNIKEVGEPSFFIPVPLDHCALKECIARGAEKIGWKEKWKGWNTKNEGRYRKGIGMSVMNHASGAGGFLLEHSSAIIKLNEDGSAVLTVSPCEMGQGILCALSQIAADTIGIDFEDVQVVTGDTDVTLFDIGSHASRSTLVIGNAVVDAGNKIKAILLESAAEKLQKKGVEELDVSDGKVFVKASPESFVEVKEIAFEAIYNYTDSGAHISATGSYLSTSHNPSFQAGFAEVEVDTETGQVNILRIVLAHDIGKAINPLQVEGQLEGGAAQAIGLALYEDFVVDTQNGHTLSDSFSTYKIPSTLDMPPIDIILVEDPAPAGPFGAKGVGEPGMVNITPSIANAIYDAVGVRIETMPLSPEKILAALKAKN